MKLATEDSNLEPVDDFLQLLVTLWRLGFSVNLNVARAELNVYPAPDDMISDWIRQHYEMLLSWLPGECDGCGAWAMIRTECFWPPHPLLDPKCLTWAMTYFETHNKWPEPNWYPGEERPGEECDELD